MYIYIYMYDCRIWYKIDEYVEALDIPCRYCCTCFTQDMEFTWYLHWGFCIKFSVTKTFNDFEPDWEHKSDTMVVMRYCCWCIFFYISLKNILLFSMILLCNRVIAIQCNNQRSVHKEYVANMSYLPPLFHIHPPSSIPSCPSYSLLFVVFCRPYILIGNGILVNGYGHLHFKVHLQLHWSVLYFKSWTTACPDDMVYIKKCHFYINRYLTGHTIRNKRQLSGWEWTFYSWYKS